jgi:hypothetical protein
LAKCLNERSCLVDAASGETITVSDLRRTIAAFSGWLLSIRLKADDRIPIVTG